jgi:hypothetical protein
MNRNTLIVGVLALVSLVLIAVGVSQLGQGQGGAGQAPAGPTPTLAQVKRISVQDLNIKLRGTNPPLVWELRSVEAFAGGHIPGAQAVQLTDIPTLAQKLDRKKSIVTLCA